MMVKDIELQKINSSSIKRIERVLYEIDKYELQLLNDFDFHINEILGETLTPILQAMNYKNPPKNFLQVFHKSYLTNPVLQEQYEKKLKIWFADKTEQLKNSIKDKNSYKDVISILPVAFALASLATTAFHKRPNMVLRDVQKMAGVALCEGDIAELGTGEGKTLAAILPMYLNALREKGAHLITANSYLAKRDYEETLPIFEGLGLTSGFLPDDIGMLCEIEGKNIDDLTIEETNKLEYKLKLIKQAAYKKDITYGSKQTFAFDYLRDNVIRSKEDMLQRVEYPGFALIDEVDDCLIDDGLMPYRISIDTPMYEPNMSLKDLCAVQDLPFDEINNRVIEMGINPEKLSYEEARYISNVFGKVDILPDPKKYQEAAQRFFKYQKILTTEDNTYGFRTGRELYEAILDTDKYDARELTNNYGIVYCKELQEFKITDKCLEDFLRFCYFSFQINSLTIVNEAKILGDSNYIKDTDYYYTDDGLKLTMAGATKILNDPNYPEFIENYNKYLSTVSLEATNIIHYFKQAVIANLILKNGEDYIVDNEQIKVLKNGRIQVGSNYSNGLHQALEIKENIPFSSRTKETLATSSVTQRDFFSRYDMFSGMTGTSNKKIFGSIYGKNTVEIPKNAYYNFYGRRGKPDAVEPIGVLKKNTEFALTREDKINLIIASIKNSRKIEPQQPVLLVVSNVDEIPLLQEALYNNKIRFNTLTPTTSKEDEAFIIAFAGAPGMVTITTEMAGRGTDIKMGGDRETAIDIALERHIRLLEKKAGMPLEFTSTEKDYLRKRIDTALVNSTVRLTPKDVEEKIRESMKTVGLKVISSGFFETTRIDRQLEGRTGRNGISGICERYATPDDLKEIGLDAIDSTKSLTEIFSGFRKTINGNLVIPENEYKNIMKNILDIQSKNESIIAENIKDTQILDNYAIRLVEQYRDKRRKIVCEDIETKDLIEEMITNATDAIISSYLKTEKFDKEELTKPLNENDFGIDIDAVSLEVKQTLGISFDPNIITKSNINLLELRDMIIRTAKKRYSVLGKYKDKDALLTQSDYLIQNIVDIVEQSHMLKNMSIIGGLGESADDLAKIEIYNQTRKLQLESAREGIKQILGLPLTAREFKQLESIKNRTFTYQIKETENKEEFDVVEPKREENNFKIIDRIKKVKEKIDERNRKKLQGVEEKVIKLIKEGKVENLESLYDNIDIRPLEILDKIESGKRICRLVIVRDTSEKTIKSKRTSLH